MDALLDILKIVLPALIVFFTAYFLIRSFLENEFKTMMQENKNANRSTSLPLQLQAYERLILFLERISPANLITRTGRTDISASRLQMVYLQNIRNEFEHNMSQQLYISSDAWEYIKSAKEDALRLINKAASETAEGKTGAALSEKILELSLKSKDNRIEEAKTFLKEEARKLF